MTFSSNVCSHKPLKRIDLEDDTKPRAFHTPAHVPIYWQKQVETDLIRDEKLGVLERAFSEPVIWCSLENKSDHLEELINSHLLTSVFRNST